MANYPKQIKSAYVSTPGDLSVGLQGESAMVQADGDYLIDLNVFDEADIPEVIETFRKDLITTFSHLWDDTPTVLFDFEQAD